MGEVIKILRRSIHAFSQNYHSLALVATFLAFPVSAASLLSQSVSFAGSPNFRTASHCFRLLFEAAGFPSSPLFSLLSFKLSLAIFLFMSTLPFTLTLLILAKASIFRIIHGRHPRLRPSLSALITSLLHVYPSLLLAHLSGCLLILSANAAVVSALFLSFNTLDILHVSSTTSAPFLSAAGVVSYDDDSGGCLAILKALVLGLASVEALFQYRVVRPYRRSGVIRGSAIWEAFCITYMHSLLLVLDAVIACTFVMNCKSVQRSPWAECRRPSRKDWEDEVPVEV